MKNLILLSLLLGLMACSSPAKKEIDSKEVIKKEIIGKNLSANRYTNIYFSAQPNTDDYKALKESGFVLVVNLREPSEYNESEEQTLVRKNGMKYINVPFGSSAQLNDAFINKITKQVVKYRKAGNILIHCSSGNRAGIWAGGHFFKDHGYSKAKSIEISQKLGITKSGPLDKLKTYLNKK